MESIQKELVAVVYLATEHLSDIELAVLNNCAQADFSPKGRLFDYESNKHLFDLDDGQRMSRSMKKALAVVVNMRLSGN